MSTIAAFIGDVSPKLKSSLNWGFIASLLLEVLHLATPANLAFLGPFEPLAWALIPIVTAIIAGYAKTDPLREAGKAAQASPALDVADLLKQLEALLPDKTQPVVADAIAVAKSIPAVAAQVAPAAPVEPAPAHAAPVAPAAPPAPTA